MVASDSINRENEIKTSLEHYKSNFRNIDPISEMVGLFDITHRKILYLSSSFQEYLGYSADEMSKDPSLIRQKLYPKDADQLFKLFTTSSPSPSEIEYRIKGEENRWLRTTIIPIFDSQGNITKNINFTRDITYSKKLDQQGASTYQMNLLGEIAAAFAHEIRNPLTSIKGFLQLMGQDKSNPYQQIVLQETEKIESVINEFLMLAQSYPKFDFVLSDLKDIVTDIFHTINPEALQKKIKISITFETNIPPVFGSPTQIKQALMNLVKNAFQSMPPPGGKVFISVAASAAGFVSIKIKDEGKGMSPEKLNRLGIPCYSNKEEGAGLGIMISRQIIKNHRGCIRFTSEIGKGTTVEVILPSADESAYYDKL